MKQIKQIAVVAALVGLSVVGLQAAGVADADATTIIDNGTATLAVIKPLVVTGIGLAFAFKLVKKGLRWF